MCIFQFLSFVEEIKKKKKNKINNSQTQNCIVKIKRKQFDRKRIKLFLKHSALYILSKEKRTDITKAI